MSGYNYTIGTLTKICEEGICHIFDILWLIPILGIALILVIVWSLRKTVEVGKK